MYLENIIQQDPGIFYNGDDVWSIATNQEKVEGKEADK